MSQKLIVTWQKEREELLAMGIICSDEDNNIYTATMHVDASYSDHSYSKSARLDNELAHWNRHPLEDVASPLQYWLDK